MNWKRAFWISLVISIILIFLLVGNSVKLAFKQVDMSNELSRKQNDLNIAVKSFNNHRFPKDSIFSILKNQKLTKRARVHGDTMLANSIRVIYQGDSIIKIKQIRK